LQAAAPRRAGGSATIAAMRARLRVACTLGLSTLGVATLGAATGCERLLSIHDPVAGDAAIDGIIDPIDGGLPPGSPLLLSEVVLTPDAAEMIEIVNTSSQDVDLSTYYLSDSGNYYRLPMDKTVDMTDFIVKFPANAVIGGHKAITIAIDTPTNFAATYNNMPPSYSLRDGSLTTIAMNGTPNLTNAGEPIILFQWDGRSDLVRDVDILLAGIPSVSNPLPNKSNVTQDGPDTGSETSQYAVDLHSMTAQAAAPGNTLSTKRIALDDGHEMHSGNSNGPSGDDETSENTSVTWDDGSTAHPFTTPTPGDVPSQLLR
jgi:hypothetical protein